MLCSHSIVSSSRTVRLCSPWGVDGLDVGGRLGRRFVLPRHTPRWQRRPYLICVVGAETCDTGADAVKQDPHCLPKGHSKRVGAERSSSFTTMQKIERYKRCKQLVCIWLDEILRCFCMNRIKLGMRIRGENQVLSKPFGFARCIPSWALALFLNVLLYSYCLASLQPFSTRTGPYYEHIAFALR